MELSVTKYHDSEISKESDFNFAAKSPVNFFNALFDQLFADISNSVIIDGLDVLAASPASMNVKITDGFGFRKASGEVLHLGFDTSVSIPAADPSNDRIDIVEIRYAETDIDTETRAFQDPATGIKTYTDVATKTKVSIKVQVISGTPGSGIAPNVDAGWTKIAEILVPYGVSSIIQSNIRAVTSVYDTEENSAWTAQKAVTFRIGSQEKIKRLFTEHVRATIGIHGAVSVATANALIIRDSNGRAKVADPAAPDDIATRKNVDERFPIGEIKMIDANSAGATVTAGSFVVGAKYKIASIGTTDFTAIGASANTVGIEFVATGVGTGTGTALCGYSGEWVDNVTMPGWFACIPANSVYGCPNLTDRFVCGKAVAGAGATGGTNSYQISSAQLPTHTHTINHDHDAVTSGGMSANTTHGHEITDPGHAHFTGGLFSTGPGASGDGARFSGQAGFTTGPSTTGISINESASLDHTHSVDLPSFSGSSGDGGFANSAVDNRPAFYSVIFIRKCF